MCCVCANVCDNNVIQLYKCYFWFINIGFHPY